MMQDYNPFNWFWIVDGDESKGWSSALGGYVSDYPRNAVTRIDSETSLNDVLRPHGLVLPAPTADDYAAAIQRHVDAIAKARGYSDGVALSGYSTSTVPTWAAEAAEFISWRDQVWMYAYTELAKVQGGQRAVPTISGLIAELPTIKWPGG